MKNKLLRNGLFGVCAILILFAGIYLGISFYYSKVFMVNTWVGSVYCTGKTCEEVNKELLLNAKAPFLTILDRDGTVYTINPEDIGFKTDYTEQLRFLFEKQDPFKWPVYLLGGINNTDLEVVNSSETPQPKITFQPELLKNAVSNLSFVTEEENTPKDFKIVMTDQGYALKNTLENRLNTDVMYQYLNKMLSDDVFLRNGFKEGMLTIDLKQGDCYENIALTEEQEIILKQWNIVQEYVNCDIIYDMGTEQIELAGPIASSFLAVDEAGALLFNQEGQPVISLAQIESFINSLADSYNTYKKELHFTSTAGEKKTVPYVTYGTELDTKSEMNYLVEAFTDKRSEIHIPTYSREAYTRGKNDIGNTYIEVDMGNQKLYGYLEGELIIETDIVTGNVKRKMSTPEGVVYVYRKQRNRTLRGPGYASFVKYWMPVKGGIGLHDAAWRDEFGGDIYKTDGSHGCINIPRDAMSMIYEQYEVGTPVIMFY